MIVIQIKLSSYRIIADDAESESSRNYELIDSDNSEGLAETYLAVQTPLSSTSQSPRAEKFGFEIADSERLCMRAPLPCPLQNQSL